MPKSCDQIAIWAKACSHGAQSGLPIAENLELSGCFPEKKRAAAIDSLRKGKPLSECFFSYYPDLSLADISFLNAASKTGKLAKGFDLISSQYFTKASAQSLFLSAFIYPVGIIMIGLFLISLQSVLYKESSLEDEAVQFGVRVVLLVSVLYLAKKVLLARPPIFAAVIRRMPPFRKLSNLFSVQRLVWVLNEGSISAMPVREIFQLAGESGGRSKYIQKADLVVERISRGEDFQQAFKDFNRCLPKGVHDSIPVISPYDLPNWAGLLMCKTNETCSITLETIRKLSKPVALVILSPLIFWVIHYLWQVMANELGQRFQQIF